MIFVPSFFQDAGCVYAPVEWSSCPAPGLFGLTNETLHRMFVAVVRLLSCLTFFSSENIVEECNSVTVTYSCASYLLRAGVFSVQR